jgi:hypothetical protein
MRMRFVTAAVAATSLFAGFAEAAPAHMWSHRYVHAENQSVTKMVVDPFGNIVMCGDFYTELDIGQIYVSAGISGRLRGPFRPVGKPALAAPAGRRPA